MSFLDKLRPASWRGVPFHLEESTFSFGRRIQIHEFVKRDKPFVEDLGRKTRTGSYRAWLCGTQENGFDPWPERDALIAAIEQPGIGTFVHSYYGDLRGHMHSGKVTEATTTRGGWVGIDIEFVEAGEKDFRSVAFVDTKSAAASSIEKAYDTAAKSFGKRYNGVGGQSHVLEDSIAIVKQLRDDLRVSRNLMSIKAQGALQLLTSLGNTQFNDAVTLGRSVVALVREANSLAGLINFSRPAIPAFKTVGRAQQKQNSDAFVALIRSAAVIRHAEMSVDLVSNSPRYGNEDTELRGIPKLLTRAEMIQARESVSQVITDRMLVSDDEETRAALVEVRTTAVQHMTSDGEHLARTFQTTCCDGNGYNVMMPAIVVAYRHYDSLTEETVVQRNKISNPLFIHAFASLELLAVD